jgi:hypothetical protein
MQKVVHLAAWMIVTCLAELSWGQAVRRPAVPEDRDFGVIIYSSKWPTTTIGVCWETPSEANALLRGVVRRAISETWERYSSLRFVGWARCEEGSQGIRIAVDEGNPHVKNVGKYLDGMKDGMVLNFNFSTWSPSCQRQTEFCVRAIAVHEFGHAIGFTHEQNRTDAPAECRKESQGTSGDFLVTRYDPFSIMNYCNPSWNGDGDLSDLDIYSVRKIYGM